MAQLINKNPDASAFTNEDQEVINIIRLILEDSKYLSRILQKYD